MPSNIAAVLGHGESAMAWAEAQVGAARDDPAARLELLARVYRGPVGHAPRHLPFRRAALSFMRWQAHRGVLNALDAAPPATPTAPNWYRAHNHSIVSAFLEHRELAETESAPERLFMNVAIVRVLHAHALVAAPRLALGRFAPLGRVLGDPRLGMTGAFLSLGRVLPDRYPLKRDVETYLAGEHHLGRMLDYAVIAPKAQRMYEWAAQELGEPRLLELIRDGNPIYAWPFEKRHVWRSEHMPLQSRVLQRATRAR